MNYFSQLELAAWHFVISEYLLILFTAGWLLSVRMLGSKCKYVPAILIGLLGAFWIAYSDSILDWASQLGTDSFDEASNFDWREAFFLVSSLKYILHFNGMRTILPVLGWALMLLGGLYFLLGYKGFKAIKLKSMSLRSAMLAVASVVFIALPLYVQAGKMLIDLDLNSAGYEVVRKNFHNHPVPALHERADRTQDENKLDVVVYIGESTSVMDMGLYGYPRDTTPMLDKFHAQDDGLLVFHNVFSTHTHTSPSLLEALSVAVDPAENYLPINKRRRTSVVDLLKQVDIPIFCLATRATPAHGAAPAPSFSRMRPSRTIRVIHLCWAMSNISCSVRWTINISPVR